MALENQDPSIGVIHKVRRADLDLSNIFYSEVPPFL